VSLGKRAALSLVLLAIAMGLVLFLAAGTVDYWQGWVYLGVFFGTSGPITLHLGRKNPALLERRLRGGPTAEKEPRQKIIMVFTSLGFLGLLVVPGLDHRFGWSSVPVTLVVLGYVLTLLGLAITFRVYRENPFASATIEIASDQRVISTGPYAIVRHPMYAGGGLYLLGMPLALGSYWGLVALVAMVPALLWRLLDEERFLRKNLSGYTEYCAEVRWRLVPRVF
jgi:protein-S-isoprenylcysteine O-methyltransferase Ste14